MMKKTHFIILMLSCLFLQTSLFAQYTLKGTIKDAVENTPVPFTQIRVMCMKEVFMSDVNGVFSIQINKDSCEVEFFQPLFESLQRVIVFSSKSKEIKVDILLQPITTRLEEAKVSVSKYETNPELSTNSLVVLQPKLSENKNFVSVNNLINSAGGIVIVDNEPQIRGGSGYSSGMGSRVMIMLDDMPLLRPDAGRPMWNFIPMESIEQVEILKGAASVLFGSAALTGAINVLTAYPRSKPQTIVTTFATMYKPQNPFQTSWLNTNPVEFGLSFFFFFIIKKNFDFVIGGEVYNDQSYIGPQERIAFSKNYNSSTRGKFEQRYRMNFATRYRFEKIKGLSVSLNGNFMYSNNAQSYVWFDADTNIFRTYDGSLYQFKEFTFYVDPCVKYLSSKGAAHTFRNRILFSDSKELTGSLDAQAMMVFDEYQYNKTIQKIGMNIVAGASNQYSTSYGPVFSGEGDPHLAEETGPSSAYANNFAMYTQLEQKFLKKRNLTIQLGGRWEFYNLWGPRIESEKKNKPIFRVGANYQIFTTKTAIRGSFGQGYRFPTIGEKFISLTVGDYGFYPNPQLRPETSWNFEIGVMQPFQVFGLRGMFDACYFHQEYEDFIEFSMGAWGSSPNPVRRYGYKFLNIGPARVNGIDLSFVGEGRISKDIKCIFTTSYTWSNPTTKDPALIYYTYKSSPDSPETIELSFLNSSSDTTRNVLKYRIEHMVKVDLEFAFFKKFALGGTLVYYSAMRNVDRFMFVNDANNPTLDPAIQEVVAQYGDLPFYNFYNFFEANKNGALTLDLRASYYFNKVSVSFIVKNVTNRLYALRPLYAEPPRTYTLQLIVKI
jgi:iron complex outermembrane receptor protein